MASPTHLMKPAPSPLKIIPAPATGNGTGFTFRPIPTSTAPPATILLNTDTLRDFDNHYVHRDPAFGFDRSYCVGFPRSSDDSLSAPRSHNQVLNLTDQFMANPYPVGPLLLSAAIPGRKRGHNWDAYETDVALNISIDMPGLDKEDVKITVEQNSLLIKGEGKKEKDDDDNDEKMADKGRKFCGKMDLPAGKRYKTGEIKAEMKNGVLKMVVPKVKEDDRIDVLLVKVE
ncbi:heat shock 22 kDa protein, mitochondrial-like [Populus nigra]|uniref:heat shock 22 kDa protein, mitochondrial-like n=1 Tax=Populus nigra TaxID=3691 RepID=UPI002B26BD11|nr:heat shock 22 kDa protein, mitochondrial-like [Populus nigra]